MARNATIMISAIAVMALLSARPAAADPQPMQTMTTVGGPTVAVAQADSVGQPDGIGRRATTAPPSPTVAAPDRAPTAASQPVQRPSDQEYVFVVNEIAGNVSIAPVGTDPLRGAWSPLQVGDRIGQGMVVRLDMKSRAKLVGHPDDPPTVMLLEPGTVIAFSELAVRNGRQHARLALGVGAVKAGVAESGDVRSDMEITTPSATLSKRGTDIFRVEYMNGRFRMSLSDQGRGLLQAIQHRFGAAGTIIDSQSRFVTRGQFVTQEMFNAIDHVKFEREINVNDFFGQTPNEVLTLLFNRGIAFTLPFGNNPANLLGSPTMQRTDGQTTGIGDVMGTTINRVRNRGEGDFGVGQTILPGNPLFGGSNRKINGPRQITNRDGKQMSRRAGARMIRHR